MKKTTLQIKSNVVWQVEKIKDDTWIISSWFLKDWSEIEIQNLDAWNSVELMRIAISWNNRRGFSFIVKIILWLLSVVIAILFMYFLISLFNWDEKEITEKPSENIFTQTPNIQTEEPEEPEKVEQKEIENEAQKSLRELEIERLKMEHSFSIQSLQNEKNILQNEYNSLYKLFEQEREKTAILKKENDILKLQNTPITSEEKKYMEVWEKISDLCKKTKTKECLELFF